MSPPVRPDSIPAKIQPIFTEAGILTVLSNERWHIDFAASYKAIDPKLKEHLMDSVHEVLVSSLMEDQNHYKKCIAASQLDAVPIVEDRYVHVRKIFEPYDEAWRQRRNDISDLFRIMVDYQMAPEAMRIITCLSKTDFLFSFDQLAVEVMQRTLEGNWRHGKNEKEQTIEHLNHITSDPAFHQLLPFRVSAELDSTQHMHMASAMMSRSDTMRDLSELISRAITLYHHRPAAQSSIKKILDAPWLLPEELKTPHSIFTLGHRLGEKLKYEILSKPRIPEFIQEHFGIELSMGLLTSLSSSSKLWNATFSEAIQKAKSIPALESKPLLNRLHGMCFLSFDRKTYAQYGSEFTDFHGANLSDSLTDLLHSKSQKGLFVSIWISENLERAGSQWAKRVILPLMEQKDESSTNSHKPLPRKNKTSPPVDFQAIRHMNTTKTLQVFESVQAFEQANVIKQELKKQKLNAALENGELKATKPVRKKSLSI